MGRNGIRDALVAALLFGLSAPIAKVLAGNLSPQLLAGLLYIGSGIGLAALRFIGPTAIARDAALKSTDIPFLAGAIAVGGVAAPVLLMLGLRQTPASSASLLLNLEAVFTAVIAWGIFHENIDARIAAGLLAIVIGGGILSWSGSFQLPEYAGALSIAGACLCWGIDNNLTQKISGTDAMVIATVKGLVAGTVNTGLGAWLGQWPATRFMWIALCLGFVSYGLSLVLYIRALGELGAARAGNYFSVAPFVGAVAGVVLLKEAVTPGLLGAGVLMGVGVWLHLKERHEHRHVHEPTIHEHRHIHDEHHQHTHSPGAPAGEPHTHPHRHERLEHSHPHYPDIHHRHHH